MKKLLSLLLAIMLIISVVPLGAFEFTVSAEDYYEEWFYDYYLCYTVENDEATITGYSGTIESDFTIPDTLGGYPVTRIGDSAFRYCFNITSVTIPSSITYIGYDAFYNCYNIQDVYVDSIYTWFGITFENYYANPISDTNAYLNTNDYGTIIDLVIPENNSISIGDYAFYEYEHLNSITLSSGSSLNVGYYSFYDCYNLQSVYISSMSDWLNCYFSYNDSNPLYNGADLYLNGELVTDVVVPDDVTWISNYAFSGYDSITSITIPASVTYIGENAFADCDNFTSVYITDISAWCNINFDYSYSNPLYFADNLYVNGELVTELVIPDGVTEISSHTFSVYSKLTSVTIPDSVTSIGYDAFYGCENLESVYITDMAAWCNIDFSSSYSNPLYYADNLYLNGELVTDIVIPDGVTSIKGYLFSAGNIENITLPDSVTDIGAGAFEGTAYYNDESNWQDNVLYIGNHLIKSKETLTGEYIIKPNTRIIADSAFKNCKNLTGITIPDSVTSIGDSAFYGCTGLITITIPGNVKSIGYSAFFNCDSLVSANICDGVISIDTYAFRNCDRLTSITISDSVTSIGTEAFYYTAYYNDENNWQDDVLYIGNHVIDAKSSISGEYTIRANTKSIAVHAFNSCSGLTSVTIPDSVTSIGSSAFSWCSSLVSITVPDGVTSIGRETFYRCTSLVSITIPDSVTSIDESAFSGCSSLTDVYITDISAWCNISFSNRYSNSSSNPFYYADNLYLNGELVTDLVIPDGVTSISDYAFSWCDSLISVSIGNGVTSIGDYAFYYCNNLTSITIPDSVISIGNQAFYHCDSLTRVRIGNGVASIGDYAFSGCDGLTSITIPNSVTSMGDSAFSGCSSLTEVWYTGSENDKSNIGIGANNLNLTSATWHYNTCNVDAHTYSNNCDADCNSCEWIRTPSDHIYDNNCDIDCNVCGKERTPPHTYDNACDAECNDCGDIRVPDVHKVIATGSVLTLENSTSYPFSYSDGVYTSTNKSDGSASSFVITAEFDCTLTLQYSVSSEQNYDKLTIYKNLNVLDTISGTVSNKTIIIVLNAGDTVTITYSKDGSLSRDNDCGSFKITSEYYTDVFIPADAVVHSCDVDVICDVCGAVAIEAKEHIYDNNCDADCNVCGDIRTPSDHIYDNNCDVDCNECGGIRIPSEHVYDNNCDAGCNECGEERTPPHTYDNACDAECNDCDNTRTPSDHIYDNNCDAECNECGDVRTPPHTYDNACDDECNDCDNTRTPSDHIYDQICDEDCNVCGDVRETTHTYTNNCDSDCNVCGGIRIPFDHVYDNNCDIECNVCGGERTPPHTYDNACDAECNDCGDVRVPDVHKVIDTRNVLTFENSASYPFSYSDGVYTSTNKSHSSSSSFVITAVYDYTLTLEYSVSSEQNYDKLTIYKNSTALDVISGTVSNKSIAIELNAGDTVTIKYSKDFSASIGSDCGSFKITSEYYTDVFVPADAVMHSCDEEVICDICGAVAVEAKDHTYYNNCDADCNVCGFTRTPFDHIYDNNCDVDCNECGGIRIPSAHVYDNNCDAGCNECGEERTPPHTYDNACDAECNDCYFTRVPSDHVYYNNCDATCNECGEVRTPPHTYDNACDAECNDCYFTRVPSDHVYDNTCDTTCNECGEIREITHTYDNNCDGVCNVCYFTRVPSDHIYNNNCDAGCNECGGERTPPHTYDNACDAECNVCGDIRIPSDHVYNNNCDAECNECGDVRVPDVHKVFIPSILAFENSASYPFSYSNGTYTSTNKAHNSSSSFVITAEYNYILTLQYSVSSEKNYDKLTISKNSTVLDTISGTVSNKTITIELNAGDTVTITYSKDSSQSSGSDRGSFKITSEYYTDVFVPADAVIHSCDVDVICDVCGAVAIEAKEHIYGNNCDADCNVCGDIRIPFDHIYDNNCDVDCNECGDIRIPFDHVYDNNCDVDCNECGAIRTPFDHVYDNNCDATCNECGDIRIPDVHKVMNKENVLVLENSISYPFSYSDGVYTSTNKSHNTSSSFVITAVYDYELTLQYSVSSQKSYDKLTIYKNSTTLDTISGTVTDKTITISLNAGDTVTITYSKNGSTSSGDDCGSFKITSEYTTDLWVHADIAEHLCHEDVICDVCGEVAVEAKDHTYDNDYDYTCNICKFSRAPHAPTLNHKYSGTIILNAVDGLEYSIDGINWQDSVVFTGLTENTEYTFVQRVKQSENAMTSAPSDVFTVYLKASQEAPNAPMVLSFTDTMITLLPVADCEYSIDGINWQHDNVFRHLLPATQYVIYQRVAATDTAEASESVTVTKTTDKSVQTNIPLAPTMESHTANSITLNAVDGCEYSIDGKRWQESTTFTGLSCGTEYTFYQRYKEDEDSYAGNASVGALIKTDKGTKQPPNAPSLYKKTHNSVMLVSNDAYEYSMDSVNWQTSPVFTELNPSTNYVFFCRYAENDRYYASNASAYLIVRTNETPQCAIEGAHNYDSICDPDCNYCGETRTDYHVFDNACDTDCNECGTTRTVGSHVYTSKCDPACNECGKERDGSPHTYTNACDKDCNECGEIRQVVDHVYNNACDAQCNVCYAIRTIPDHVYSNNCDIDCNECGVIRQVVDHVYTNACDKYCNECGDVRDVPEHIFTSDCDISCNVCDYIREVQLPHTYSHDCDETCNVCGAIRTTPNHIYDNDCDTSCNECGATRVVVDHIYDNNCDVDCNECGDIRIPFDHVYDNNCDTECNECQKQRAPKPHTYSNSCDEICNECGDQRIVAGHIFDDHNDLICNICGETRQESGHLYDNNCDVDCNICGAVRDVSEHVYDDACDKICNECSYARTAPHIDDNDDNVCDSCKDTVIITGDINGDRVINNKDLGIFMQYLNDWEVEILTDAADVNDDGSVNNKDYGILMQYCNGWDVELQ